MIWDKWQQTLEPLREQLDAALKKSWQEWEIPRELPESVRAELVRSTPFDCSTVRLFDRLTAHSSGRTAGDIHADWWQARIARQKDIDASIAAKAEFEYLYDKPYENKKAVRVAGPFTVKSLSHHRVLGVDEDDELIDPLHQQETQHAMKQTFPQMILDNLKTAGVQQIHKEDWISYLACPMAGRAGVRGRALHLNPPHPSPLPEGRRDKNRKTRRHLHRPRIRHRPTRRLGGSSTRSRRCGFRRTDCLRLQLRSPTPPSLPSSANCPLTPKRA